MLPTVFVAVRVKPVRPVAAVPASSDTRTPRRFSCSCSASWAATIRPRLSTVLSWELSSSDSVPSVTVTRIAALTTTSMRPKPASPARGRASDISAVIGRSAPAFNPGVPDVDRPAPERQKGRTRVRPSGSVVGVAARLPAEAGRAAALLLGVRADALVTGGRVVLDREGVLGLRRRDDRVLLGRIRAQRDRSVLERLDLGGALAAGVGLVVHEAGLHLGD